MLTLFLTRHATTKANEHKVFSGFGEAMISHQGEKEIKALTKGFEKFHIDAIYSSPSARAVQTIEGIAKKKNKEVQVLEALREIHFGDFEGLSFKEMNIKYPEELSKMINLGPHYCYPNGESLVSSYKRTAVKMAEIKKKHEGEKILICAHAGTIRNILSYAVCGSHELHWHFKIENASLTVVTIENDFAVVEKLNDTCFIQDMI